MARHVLSSSLLAALLATVPGCGAWSADEGPRPVPVATSVAGDISCAGGTVVAVEGTGFDDAVGGTALLVVTAVEGTPFADGTSATVEIPGLVVSPTRVEGTVPGIPVTGDVAVTVTVVLPDAGPVGAPASTVLGPRVASVEPATFAPDAATPFVVEGANFDPAAPAPVVEIRALEGTPFANGTSAAIEVPVSVVSNGRLEGVLPAIAGDFLPPGGGGGALPAAGGVLPSSPPPQRFTVSAKFSSGTSSLPATWPAASLSTPVVGKTAATVGDHAHVVTFSGDAVPALGATRWSWSMTRTPPTGTDPRASGTPVPGRVRIETDRADAAGLLLLAAAQQTPFDRVEIESRDEEGNAYLHVVLGTAVVHSVVRAAGSSEDGLTVEVGFASITIAYAAADGAALAAFDTASRTGSASLLQAPAGVEAPLVVRYGDLGRAAQAARSASVSAGVAVGLSPSRDHAASDVVPGLVVVERTPSALSPLLVARTFLGERVGTVSIERTRKELEGKVVATSTLDLEDAGCRSYEVVVGPRGPERETVAFDYAGLVVTDREAARAGLPARTERATWDAVDRAVTGPAAFPKRTLDELYAAGDPFEHLLESPGPVPVLAYDWTYERAPGAPSGPGGLLGHLEVEGRFTLEVPVDLATPAFWSALGEGQELGDVRVLTHDAGGKDSARWRLSRAVVQSVSTTLFGEERVRLGTVTVVLAYASVTMESLGDPTPATPVDGESMLVTIETEAGKLVFEGDGASWGGAAKARLPGTDAHPEAVALDDVVLVTRYGPASARLLDVLRDGAVGRVRLAATRPTSAGGVATLDLDLAEATVVRLEPIVVPGEPLRQAITVHAGGFSARSRELDAAGQEVRGAAFAFGLDAGPLLEVTQPLGPPRISELYADPASASWGCFAEHADGALVRALSASVPAEVPPATGGSSSGSGAPRATISPSAVLASDAAAVAALGRLVTGDATDPVSFVALGGDGKTVAARWTFGMPQVVRARAVTRRDGTTVDVGLSPGAVAYDTPSATPGVASRFVADLRWGTMSLAQGGLPTEKLPDPTTSEDPLAWVDFQGDEPAIAGAGGITWGGEAVPVLSPSSGGKTVFQVSTLDAAVPLSPYSPRILYDLWAQRAERALAFGAWSGGAKGGLLTEVTLSMGIPRTYAASVVEGSPVVERLGVAAPSFTMLTQRVVDGKPVVTEVEWDLVTSTGTRLR